MLQIFDILSPDEVAKLIAENSKLSKQLAFLRIFAILTIILQICDFIFGGLKTIGYIHEKV